MLGVCTLTITDYLLLDEMATDESSRHTNGVMMMTLPFNHNPFGCNGRSTSYKMKHEEPYRPQSAPSTVENESKIEIIDEDAISLPESVRKRKPYWTWNRTEFYNYVMKILVWIEILYSAFTLIVIIVLKIYKGNSDNQRLSKMKLAFDEIQYHLRGLGLRFVNVVELESLEAFVGWAIWFMFALAMMLQILHLGMAAHFFRGLRIGDPKRLKLWMTFGFSILVLDILFFPLSTVICDRAAHVAGVWPLCQPSRSKWLHIFFKTLFYLSTILAYPLRRELRSEAKNSETYKLNLMEVP